MTDAERWIGERARPNVRALAPYRAARHEHQRGILLDANENPYGDDGAGQGARWNRYPDPLQSRLRARLAALNGVEPANIFVGSGSDEAIDLLIRIFCRPGRDAVAALEPSYGMYRVAAALNDAGVVPVPLDASFALDAPGAAPLLRDAAVRLFFCCSPNNPTGNCLQEDAMLELCRERTAIIVADEAYVEFAGRASIARHVAAHPNLVVLRTLSKAWGGAGIRLGYAIAHPAVVDLLLKVKLPYNVGAPAAAAALALLQSPERMRSEVAAIVAERERLAARLWPLRRVLRVFPSDANFLLVRFDDAPHVVRGLAGRGVIVRDRSAEPGLKGCVRITVGRPRENAMLLKYLEDLCR